MHFKRLRIKDFGPIRDIEFNFERDKVYHLIGDNDSGKSMVLDAMNILCNNIANIHAKKFVSDYANSFLIEGEDFEGNIIQISRGDENWYRLIKPDGTNQLFEKIGGDVPVSIQNIVNVYVDDLKKEKFNFRYSDDKILFMNTTAGENYSFFQKALRTDKVLNALKTANRTQNALDKELDIIRSKVEFEQDKLNLNPDNSYVKEDIDVYREAVKETMAATRSLNEVLQGTSRLQQLDSLNIPSEIQDFDWHENSKKITIIKNARYTLDNITKNNMMGNVIDKTNELADITNQIEKGILLIKTIDDLNKLYAGYSSNTKLQESISEIVKDSQVAEEIVDKRKSIVDQINLTTQIKTLELKADTMDSMYTKLDTVETEVESQKLLKEVMSGIMSLGEGLDNLRNQDTLVEQNKELAIELEENKNQFMRDHNFCPVVVNSLNKKCPFSNQTLEEIMKGA